IRADLVTGVQTCALPICPLIAVDRADVTRFLRERAIPWREDSTNASPQFARNRMRHQLLPQLAREWNPAIGEMLAHTADWALAEDRKSTRLNSSHQIISY